MRVLLASDHAGFALKATLIEFVRELGHDAVDLGPSDESAVDYPTFAHLLAALLGKGDGERGILVCGTGIGVSMTANRHPGIRAALCHDAFTAEAARRHNDANVLCLGGRVTGPGVAMQIVRLFLVTPFEGGRHARRVELIERKESTS
ncbi:MAG: ribose 5-phosphate isomerase B [Acidobacteria bacterium]|nr:ribose 5-phosphate isomerase B [Acidobacteriota bacterium]